MKVLFGLRDFTATMGARLGLGMDLLIGIGIQRSSAALASNTGSSNPFG
jgi:hypothetical protein